MAQASQDSKPQADIGDTDNSSTKESMSSCEEITNQQWTEFLFEQLPDGCAPVYAAFEGDPTSLTANEKGKAFFGRGIGTQWPGYGTVVYREVAREFNTYINVASFKVEADTGKIIGSKGRESYGALHAVFIDDVQKKLAPADFWLPPTLIIETSPGNQQWWYALETPIEGYGPAEAFVRGFVARVPNDCPGAVRWGRLPVGANMKYSPTYQHHVVGGTMKKYSKKEMIKGFNLMIPPVLAPVVRARHSEADMTTLEKNDKRRGEIMAEWFRRRGMVKKEYPDKMEIVCPMETGHDNGPGTVFYYPSPDNDWRGGFKCQHLKCRGRHFGHLVRWVEYDMEQAKKGTNHG